jgi:hypothetical protein
MSITASAKSWALTVDEARVEGRARVEQKARLALSGRWSAGVQHNRRVAEHGGAHGWSRRLLLGHGARILTGEPLGCTELAGLARHYQKHKIRTADFLFLGVFLSGDMMRWFGVSCLTMWEGCIGKLSVVDM